MSIEAARTMNGREPADDYLRDLQKSPGRGKANVKKLNAIVLCFEAYANTGDLIRPRELNDLEDGIMEIKGDAARLPFYITSDTAHGQVARLVGGFNKNEWMTPPRRIREAIWVRDQDIQWSATVGEAS